MRTAFCMAIGLATVVVPAGFARGAAKPGSPAGTAIEERPTHVRGSNAGISVAVPIGKVSVDPKVLGGEPIFVRRSTVREGITIVEVSTTPFEPVLASSEGVSAQAIVRADQPASW